MRHITYRPAHHSFIKLTVMVPQHRHPGYVPQVRALVDIDKGLADLGVVGSFKAMGIKVIACIGPQSGVHDETRQSSENMMSSLKNLSILLPMYFPKYVFNGKILRDLMLL